MFTGIAARAAPYLRGVDMNAESSVSILPKSIIDGAFDLSGHSVIVGSDFAKNMRLSVGDRLAISSPSDLEKMRENYGKTNAEIILSDDYTVTRNFQRGLL